MHNTQYTLDIITFFFIKLGMEACLYLVEISIFFKLIFLLNNVTIRLTKTMNNLLKHLKIQIFNVIFYYWKLVESFHFLCVWRILDKETNFC